MGNVDRAWDDLRTFARHHYYRRIGHRNLHVFCSQKLSPDINVWRYPFSGHFET